MTIWKLVTSVGIGVAVIATTAGNKQGDALSK